MHARKFANVFLPALLFGVAGPIVGAIICLPLLNVLSLITLGHLFGVPEGPPPYGYIVTVMIVYFFGLVPALAAGITIGSFEARGKSLTTTTVLKIGSYVGLGQVIFGVFIFAFGGRLPYLEEAGILFCLFITSVLSTIVCWRLWIVAKSSLQRSNL